MAIKTANKGVSTCCIIDKLIVTLAADGAIRSEQSLDGSVQWFLVKPWSCCIGQCALYRSGAPPWPSKWPATEVHSFAAAAYFDCCNRS
jgi:hypothetical protein